MPLIRLQVVIPNVNGLPRDAVTNKFDFQTVDAAGTNVATSQIADEITKVYTVGSGPAGSIQNLLSDQVGGAGGIIKAYAMEDFPPRAPYFSRELIITPPAGKPLPHEVALVGSFAGKVVSGTPAARLRGRVYFGPLNDASTIEEGGDLRPTTGARSAIGNQLFALLTASRSAASWDWVVASLGARDNTNKEIPYEKRPLRPALITPVDRIWVDNAFDTQRRRGTRATARFIPS